METQTTTLKSIASEASTTISNGFTALVNMDLTLPPNIKTLLLCAAVVLIVTWIQAVTD